MKVIKRSEGKKETWNSISKGDRVYGIEFLRLQDPLCFPSNEYVMRERYQCSSKYQMWRRESGGTVNLLFTWKTVWGSRKIFVSTRVELRYSDPIGGCEQALTRGTLNNLLHALSLCTSAPQNNAWEMGGNILP